MLFDVIWNCHKVLWCSHTRRHAPVTLTGDVSSSSDGVEEVTRRSCSVLQASMWSVNDASWQCSRCPTPHTIIPIMKELQPTSQSGEMSLVLLFTVQVLNIHTKVVQIKDIITVEHYLANWIYKAAPLVTLSPNDILSVWRYVLL